MKKSDVTDLLNSELIPAFSNEKTKLDRIDDWYRWDPERPRWRSSTLGRENRYLMDLSRTPWLGHVVTVVAQMLYLERIYSAERSPEDTKPMWAPWRRNDMHRRQVPLHRAALAYGISYAKVTKGDTGALIRGYSPRESMAVYADPAEDEYPMYWVRAQVQPTGATHYQVVDEESVYRLAADRDGSAAYIDQYAHGMGVCPIVRYANQLDLEGRAPGEVEPLIPTAARVNKTDYDRMLAQHYNSWKIKTATKLDENLTPEELEEAKAKIAHDTILTGTGDTEFGTLPETNIKQLIDAHDSDIETLAAVSQTPATAYGKLINVSADGLVEARASLRAKVIERQTSFGGSHLQTLRLAAHAESRSDDASDFSLQGYWADIESQTLNQAVDALGKAAQMLGVPKELLWDRIPNVDLTTAESWRKYARENPTAEERMADSFRRQVGDQIDQ